MTVLILHADAFFVQSLHPRVQAVCPHARCIVTTQVRDAANVLAATRIDLFVTSLEAADGDVLDLLLHRSRQNQAAGRTMVMTGRQGVRVLVTLARLQIDGVFNLSDEIAQNIAVALDAICRGNGYWSRSFLTMLGSADARMVVRQMSAAEQLALAMMGDGCSDKVATERLGMSLQTVRSLRTDLHAKLGVHDKEGLQRTAARLSFTRFSANGVVPMGAAILVVEYAEGSKRPVPLPPMMLARCGFTTEHGAPGSNPPLKKSG